MSLAPRVLPEAQVQRVRVRLVILDLQVFRAQARLDQLDKERRVLRGLLASVQPDQPAPTEALASQDRSGTQDQPALPDQPAQRALSQDQPGMGGALGRQDTQDPRGRRALSQDQPEIPGGWDQPARPGPTAALASQDQPEVLDQPAPLDQPDLRPQSRGQLDLAELDRLDQLELHPQLPVRRGRQAQDQPDQRDRLQRSRGRLDQA